MSSHSQKKAILAYHEVMPESNYSYCVPLRQFKDQLSMLGHGSEGGLGALVTFDDGELSQMEIAAPLLLEFGIKATYFITPGLVGSARKFLALGTAQAVAGGGTFAAIARMVA